MEVDLVNTFAFSKCDRYDLEGKARCSAGSKLTGVRACQNIERYGDRNTDLAEQICNT